MSIYILTKEDSITISLENDFTFHHHADFRKAYEQNLDDKKKVIIIDFAKTNFIDSAALGMLLILREYIEESGKTIAIELINCRKEVFEILAISNFSKLFSIRK